MTYRVVPFDAAVGASQGGDVLAKKLEKLIDTQVGDGWEFVGLNGVHTQVAGSKGCFGLGATAPGVAVVTLAVFRR